MRHKREEELEVKLISETVLCFVHFVQASKYNGIFMIPCILSLAQMQRTKYRKHLRPCSVFEKSVIIFNLVI